MFVLLMQVCPKHSKTNKITTERIVKLLDITWTDAELLDNL